MLMILITNQGLTSGFSPFSFYAKKSANDAPGALHHIICRGIEGVEELGTFYWIIGLTGMKQEASEK